MRSTTRTHMSYFHPTCFGLSRLCGGVARILGTPGFFSLLRGNWAGAEQEFVLEW